MKNISSLLVAGAALAVLSAAMFPAAAQEKATDSLTAGEFTFHYGKPWERQQVVSPMRAGQLKYVQEGEGLEPVEAVIYFFGPGGAGGVEANIQRWIGQFEGTPSVEQEEKEIDGKKVHFLYAKGTYLESMGGPFSGKSAPKAGSMMLGAILESDKGAVFLKMTGPEKSVEAAKEAFIALARSPFGG